MLKMKNPSRIVNLLVIASLALVVLSALLMPVRGFLATLSGGGGIIPYLSHTFVYCIGRGMLYLVVGSFFPICLWLVAKTNAVKVSWFFAVWSFFYIGFQWFIALFDTIGYFVYGAFERIANKFATIIPGALLPRNIVMFFDSDFLIWDFLDVAVGSFAEGCMLFVPFICCIGFVVLAIQNKKQKNQAEVV